MTNNQSGKKRTLKSSKGYFQWRLARAEKITSLAEKYTSLANKKVLDVGCGQGPLSYLLYQKKANVYAIDISEKDLKKMRKFTKGMKINIKKASNESLPYQDSYFDLIFSFDVLEHVKDYQKSLAEMNRCLKKNGYIILEMTPYWTLITGHHLYDFTYLPVQYLPKKLMKWWILKKKPNQLDTPEQAWEQFSSLNKITVAKTRKLIRKHQLKIREENFLFKIPPLLETKINWIRHLGFFKEIIPMSYQVVLRKKT